MSAHFSLRRKLLMMVLGSCLILAVTSGSALYSLKVIQTKVFQLTDLSVPKLAQLSDMRYYGSEVVRLFLRVSTQGLPESEIARLEKKLEDHIQLYAAAEKNYLAMPFEAGEKALYDLQNARWEAALQLIREGVRLIRKSDDAAIARLKELNATLVPKAKVGHNEAFAQLHSFQSDISQGLHDQTQKAATIAARLLAFLVIFGSLLNLTVGFLMARALSRRLERFVEKLSREALELTTAATSISVTSQKLSAGATEQASSLSETAASMNEITAMVARSSSNASVSRETSQESRKVTEEGIAVMSELHQSVTAMDKANQNIMAEVAHSNARISEIIDIIETIRDRAKVINDIVFQTRLLSFNASVESARAGENGRGFAVVAEEVGKLAQLSGTAAREISQLLAESVVKVRDTITDTQKNVAELVAEGSARIQDSVRITEKADKVLAQIMEGSLRMEQLIQEIAASADEQSRGIHEVNVAVHELDSVVQINSDAAEVSSGAALKLKGQADSLQSLILDLNQLVRGQKPSVVEVVKHEREDELEESDPELYKQAA